MKNTSIAIVGAGLYGATVANILRTRGYDVVVYEEEQDFGGNIKSHWNGDVQCHVSDYGAHIFHTNSERIWSFVNQFSSFNNYRHYVKGRIGKSKIIDLPFNMSMFSQLLGMTNPNDVQVYFDDLKRRQSGRDQSTVEGWCLANIGDILYEQVVKNYTEKQWGRPCDQLPASIVQRLPIRLTYDSTYFHNAEFQGMPVDGYSNIVENMLFGVEVKYGFEVTQDFIAVLEQRHDHVFFSGMIDRLFGYDQGVLAYRGLRFEDLYLDDREWYQGAPVVNDLNQRRTNMTRTIEHKLFYPDTPKTGHTIITEEFSAEWKPGDRAYYPIRDAENLALYGKYEAAVTGWFPKTRLGGRLGSFQYLDMDQVIGMAMAHTKDLQ